MTEEQKASIRARVPMTISLGNILTMVGLLAAAVMGYYDLRARGDLNEQMISQKADRGEVLELRTVLAAERSARQADALAMRRELERIQHTLARIENRLWEDRGEPPPR